MTKPLLLLSLIAALGAAPVFAQDTAEPAADPAADPAPATEPAADPTADPAGRISDGLDMGEDAQAAAAPARPQTYIKETFSDWAVQCIQVEDGGEEVCQMYQLLKDTNGASVAEVNIFKLANRGRAIAGGTFVVPLETLLPEKLNITVDGGQTRRYDYSFCSQVGCYARIGFTAEDIARFKAGAAATVTLVPALAPDQKVNVSMSLSGFTAAFDAATELKQ